MAITIQDLFTRSMVITMPVAPLAGHSDTRATYSDGQTRSYDIVGELNLGDIDLELPMSRGAGMQSRATT